MCGFQGGLLAGETFLVVRSKLLVLGYLLLNLCDLCLQGGFLQNLGFLVGVDLLLGDELLKRFSWVLCDNAIDLGCGVLGMLR